MTKARARERAKAKARAGKAKKQTADAARPDQQRRAGQFDPGPGSIKSPRGTPAIKNPGASRGSARSR